MVKVSGELTKKVASIERVEESVVRKGLADGTIVIPKNKKHRISRISAIGRGMAVKINANIGLSSDSSNMTLELKKMETAVAAGADAVMDLSTGLNIKKLRKKILAECPVPLGTVPVYELACGKKLNFNKMNEDDFIDVLNGQAEDGVDFFTIHSGITIDAVRYAMKHPRLINIVSRGGALLASWMMKNKRENPYYSRFDDVIKIAKKYDITLSLGDSLRPGTIHDATDRLQVQELLTLGELQSRAFSNGVQVIIEGPGHVPLNQIEMNVKLEKSICHGAPFYVLGPLVTDSAPGYDHIVGAIGGAVAAWHGADFLCYVTPAEHLKLPDAEDVRRGVIASKIAAHAADIARGLKSALERDYLISKARLARNWEKQFKYSLDASLPRAVRAKAHPRSGKDVCTMCAEFCSMKLVEEMQKNFGVS
ncbi:MAG: phosphomethylpyrimidine synthase ThiC [Candidatus Omnitrophica bacterium]|nr:phosphomethylpyrimidine synthase ThiC [Candidatus Omnitrophota bacterium]